MLVISTMCFVQMSIACLTIVKWHETHPANMCAAFASHMVTPLPFCHQQWAFRARFNTKCFFRLIAKNAFSNSFGNSFGLVTRLARMRAVTKCANGHQALLACKCFGALRFRRWSPVDLVAVGRLAVCKFTWMATDIGLERFLKDGVKHLSGKMLLNFREWERFLAHCSASINGFHATDTKLPRRCLLRFTHLDKTVAAIDVTARHADRVFGFAQAGRAFHLRARVFSGKHGLLAGDDCHGVIIVFLWSSDVNAPGSWRRDIEGYFPFT